MATTNYTWLQLQNMSGGISCKEAEDAIKAAIAPTVLADDTVISDTNLLNIYVSAGIQRLAFPSIVRQMSLAQHKSLVLWALGQLSSNLPAGWAQAAAIQSKIADIIDCINAPTAGKKAALQAWSSSIAIDWTDSRETLMKGMAKRVANLVVSGTQTYQDVYEFISHLRNAFIIVLGANKTTVDNAILNQMKSITNIT